MLLSVNMTNEDLQVGDKVFPISWGRVKGDKYEHEYFDFRDHACGYPNAPHTIIDLHHSEDKAYEVRTDKGYGPREKYFKNVVSEESAGDYVCDKCKGLIYCSCDETTVNDAKNVHTEHCCKEHGCKYAEDDCPVVLGTMVQSFTCECCDKPTEPSNKESDDIG